MTGWTPTYLTYLWHYIVRSFDVELDFLLFNVIINGISVIYVTTDRQMENFGLIFVVPIAKLQINAAKKHRREHC